jgi:DNA-binding LacI/PurR family transcriptional regulator
MSHDHPIDDQAPARSRPATLADIAAAVGVSPSTVSRTLHGVPRASEATRRKILAAANELGFEPNPHARSLRTSSSRFVGMVVPDVTHPYFMRVLNGVSDVVEQAGYQVLLMSSARRADKERAALRALVSQRVAGILLATSGGYEPCGVPLVFYTHVEADTGDGRIRFTDADGIGQLVRHLLEHGHTRIGFIGGPAGTPTAQERREGFRTALENAWLAVPGDYLRVSDSRWSGESGTRAALDLLALDPPPTAIVAASDMLAVGAMRGLRQLGKRIPEDVALVSFGDPLFADLFEPPLTAVSHDAQALGMRAAELLLDQLREPSERRDVRLPVELVVRRSCGCTASAATGSAQPASADLAAVVQRQYECR